MPKNYKIISKTITELPNYKIMVLKDLIVPTICNSLVLTITPMLIKMGVPTAGAIALLLIIMNGILIHVGVYNNLIEDFQNMFDFHGQKEVTSYVVTRKED